MMRTTYTYPPDWLKMFKLTIPTVGKENRGTRKFC